MTREQQKYVGLLAHIRMAADVKFHGLKTLDVRAKIDPRAAAKVVWHQGYLHALHDIAQWIKDDINRMPIVETETVCELKPDFSLSRRSEFVIKRKGE